VDSKAECAQLNLAHETKTNKRQCPWQTPVEVWHIRRIRGFTTM